MPRVTVPKECIGLEFADGSKVDSNRSGQVELSDEQARQLKGSVQEARGWLAQGYTFSGAQEKSCRRCHFSAFIWQQVCPRCQQELPDALLPD